MDTSYIISLLHELMYVLIVLTVCLLYCIFKGRQALINVILGLYLALLISLIFPYYDIFLSENLTAYGTAVGKLTLFMVFTLLATILLTRLMPDEYKEKKFESFGKKILLTLGGTILVMVFSFHVLPVTELLSPGTPIQTLFADATYFFWWLIVPLVILYLN